MDVNLRFYINRCTPQIIKSHKFVQISCRPADAIKAFDAPMPTQTQTSDKRGTPYKVLSL